MKCFEQFGVLAMHWPNIIALYILLISGELLVFFMIIWFMKISRIKQNQVLLAHLNVHGGRSKASMAIDQESVYRSAYVAGMV